MRRLFIIILLYPLSFWAQDNSCESEAKCFKDFFSKGSSHGHFRNFFMLTNHFNSQDDFYANATGGAIAYRTAEIKGFQLGVKGIFTFNTLSSDLTIGEGQVWERQLFDVTRPDEKLDLDRLEELFVKYENKKWKVQVGRFDFESPLMNASDGRMKPYVYSGIEIDYDFKKRIKLSSRFINSISPRSTTHFYGLGDNIGIYSVGRNQNGDVIDYHHSIKSDFVLVNSVSFEGKKNIKLEYYNYWLDRISLNHFFSLEKTYKKMELDIQYLRQGKLLSQVNSIYYDNQSGSNVLVLQLRKKFRKILYRTNYSRVFGDRFLFPREFGREDFYGSLSRLRLEGKNNVHLIGFGEELEINNSLIKDLSIVSEQGVLIISDKIADNKYSEEDMFQVNLEMKYEFHRHLKGMEMELLWVNRFPMRNMDSSKIGFSQINLITNINF